MVPLEKPMPKLPVASVVWKPMPYLKIGAAAWIYAGGAHHTSFSQTITPEHLEDFATMAKIEMVLIDKDTKISEFKKELKWNEIFYLLCNGL